MNQNVEIACTLPSNELENRLNGDIATLLSQVEEMVELDDGYRLKFKATDDLFQQVTRFIAAERQCCTFLHFDLTVSPNHGPLFLTLGGSLEAKQFIGQMLIVG